WASCLHSGAKSWHFRAKGWLATGRLFRVPADSAAIVSGSIVEGSFKDAGKIALLIEAAGCGDVGDRQVATRKQTPGMVETNAQQQLGKCGARPFAHQVGEVAG